MQKKYATKYLSFGKTPELFVPEETNFRGKYSEAEKVQLEGKENLAATSVDSIWRK